jgi:hypothetical protein
VPRSTESGLFCLCFSDCRRFVFHSSLSAHRKQRSNTSSACPKNVPRLSVTRQRQNCTNTPRTSRLPVSWPTLRLVTSISLNILSLSFERFVLLRSLWNILNRKTCSLQHTLTACSVAQCVAVVTLADVSLLTRCLTANCDSVQLSIVQLSPSTLGASETAAHSTRHSLIDSAEL